MKSSEITIITNLFTLFATIMEVAEICLFSWKAVTLRANPIVLESTINHHLDFDKDKKPEYISVFSSLPNAAKIVMMGKQSILLYSDISKEDIGCCFTSTLT